MQIKEVSWKRQNKELDVDAESNVQLKKQINKQTDMDSNIQNSINDKIYELKQEAVMLTKKVQSQKYKNLELETIIKTIKLRMDDQRKTEASTVTESNFQNIQSLQRKIKKFQYDLQQINTKTNKVNSVITDKKHKISLLRTDRVIDSGIFRNIEKELHNSQLEFKKLLIDKVRHQKIYQNCLNEYSSLKSKAQQYFQTQGSQTKSQFTSQPSIIQESYLSEQAKSNKNIKNNNNNTNKFKEIERNVHPIRNTMVQSDLRREQKNSHFEFTVKKFLMNLNLNNAKQFIYNWHNIQNINQKYFETLNSAGDQISQLQEEIKKLQKIIRSNSIKFYKPKTQPSKNQLQFVKCQKIKNQVEKINDIAQKQSKLLKDFINTPTFSSFIKTVEIDEKASQNLQIQTLKDVLKLIEEKMNHLNYYQPPKMPQENVVMKTGRTQREKREQKLQDVMNRVKIYEESDKIMKKQEFKQEYKKMMEAGPASGSRQLLFKKKTKKVLP